MNYKFDLQWRCNKTFLGEKKPGNVTREKSNFLINVKVDFLIYGNFLGTLKKERAEFNGLSSFSREYRNDLTRRCPVDCGGSPSNCLHTKAIILSILLLFKWSPMVMTSLLFTSYSLNHMEGVIFFPQSELPIIFLSVCSDVTSKSPKAFLCVCTHSLTSFSTCRNFLSYLFILRHNL